MNSIASLFNFLALALGAGTAGSILIHDTSIDKATVTALTQPIAVDVSAQAAVSTNPHLQIERTSLDQTTRDLKGSQPRVQPKTREDASDDTVRSSRGHHPFDDYNLPLVF